MIINNLTSKPIINIISKEYLMPGNILANAIRQCEIFEITNVVNYLYDQFEKDPNKNWSIAEDVPNFTLPFPDLWLEWVKNGSRTGVMLTGKDKGNMDCCIFMEPQKGKLLHIMNFSLMLNEEGKVVQISSPQIVEDEMEVIAKFSVLFCGIAISFMHCKNVTAVKNCPSEKLQKAREKKNKAPIVTYKTLKIEPVKRILREEGQVESVGYKQALHICRGHFKDYRDGKGLFGKYKGLYWWESQVRGDVKEGEIRKIYEIFPKK